MHHQAFRMFCSPDFSSTVFVFMNTSVNASISHFVGMFNKKMNFVEHTSFKIPVVKRVKKKKNQNKKNQKKTFLLKFL